MRDEEVGQPELFLQFFQQVDHLRLDGNVQGRDRLVADDKIGVEGQGAGNTNPLALTARKLVGVTGAKIGAQSHRVEQLGDSFFDLVGIHPAMHLKRLADDLVDRHARVQAGVGVLEDHLHAAAHPPQLLTLQDSQVDAIEIDVPGGGPVKLQDGAPRSGFTAARFAHQAEGLAFVDLKGDPIHGMDRAQPGVGRRRARLGNA